MRKLKRSLKKRKGLEAKIKRQEFYNALKHGKPKISTGPSNDEAKEILKKIRGRRHNGFASPSPSPYDAGAGGAMERIKRLAGLK